MKQYRNILLIKTSSLGDVLHALPCAQALRELFPAARITWIVEPAYAVFLPGAPVLDEVLFFEKTRLRKGGVGQRLAYVRELKAQLTERKFDLVIDLQGLAKSALIAWLTGCPERIGYVEMREGSGLVSRPVSGPHADDHVVQRYLDVIRSLGWVGETPTYPALSFGEEAKVRKWLTELGIGEKYAVLVPSTRRIQKNWPAAHFATLAKALADSGLDVLLVGDKNDQEKGQAIAAQAGQANVYNLAGQTTLKELCSVLSGAAVVVGGDTGPLHIAAAVGVAAVALYGPTDPQRSAPYGAKITILQSKVPCAPCHRQACEDVRCMASISPETVYQACLDILDRQMTI